MDVALQNIGGLISFILGFIAIFWPAKPKFNLYSWPGKGR